MKRLLTGVVLGLVAACGPRGVAVPPEARLPLEAGAAGAPSLALWGVDFVQSSGSEVFAEGHCERVRYWNQSGWAKAEGAEVRFPHRADPGRAAALSSPLASATFPAGEVTGAGGVHFQNALGQSGDTETATYRAKAGRAEGAAPVELRGAGFVLRAPGFRWDAATDSFDFGGAQLTAAGAGQRR